MYSLNGVQICNHAVHKSISQEKQLSVLDQKCRTSFALKHFVWKWTIEQLVFLLFIVL